MTSPNPIPPIEPPPAIPPEPTVEPETDGPRWGSIILGLIILGVGLWYFADRTLGLELPRIEADELWPIAVIGLGVWVIVRPRH